MAVDPADHHNDVWLMIRTACAGGGITFGMEDTFKPYVESGQLVPLLQDYCPPFAGSFLYYPSRRNIAPKLRAPVDRVKRWR